MLALAYSLLKVTVELGRFSYIFGASAQLALNFGVFKADCFCSVVFTCKLLVCGAFVFFPFQLTVTQVVT